MSFTDAGTSEQFKVIIKRPYWISFWRISTKWHEKLVNMSSAMDGLQKSGSEVHEGAQGGFAASKRKCVGAGGGCLVRDVGFVSL